MTFLVWLESLRLSTWVREGGSIWGYPTVLFLHTVGLGFLVGVNIGIDLRLLGFARRMAIAPLAKFFPIMWTGFWINAVSGTILLIADATTKLVNPVFYIKMGFVALAVVDLVLLGRLVFRDPALDLEPVTLKARFIAASSIVFWLGAITAGRLMAYLGPVSGLEGFTNHIGGQ
jgi:hypothetical protein